MSVIIEPQTYMTVCSYYIFSSAPTCGAEGAKRRFSSFCDMQILIDRWFSPLLVSFDAIDMR